MSLRKLIVRPAIIVAVVVFLISLVISVVSSGFDEGLSQLGWAVVLSTGIGVFTWWQVSRKVRQGFLDGLNPNFALVPVLRETWPKVDWAALDDLASRLEALGFTRLGEFTPDKAVPAVRGVAMLLSDPRETMIVELQHFERLQPTPFMGDEHFQPRIAIGSIVGGRIRVMVSDRPVFAGLYLGRSESGVYASYPGKPIFELLDKHRRLVEFVQERTGKSVDPGYTLQRYVMLEREKQAEVHARITGMTPARLIAEFDAFSAAPKSSYSANVERLKALPTRGWREIDSAAMDASAPTAPKLASTAEDLALRQKMESGASWFFWIAGLSLVNTVTSAMGSAWGFVIGLGLTQVFSALSETGLPLLWVLNFGTIGLFAVLGWLARKPSVAAFWIGIVLFALDTLIFLIAADWVGVGFHALALYFLWSGLQAARQMKRLAAKGAASAAAETAAT